MIRRLVLSVIMLGLGQHTTAQERPGPGPLGAHLPAPGEVRELLRHHPAVRAAQAQAEAQRSRADITEGGTAEFTTRISQQSRQATDPSGRYAETSVSVERAVRAWGKADIDAELAEQGRASARWTVAEALHETSRDLLQQWLGVQRQRVRKELAEQQVALARELHRQAEARLRRGDVSRLDASLAQAELERSEAARDLAEAAHAAAQARLRRNFPGLEAQPTPSLETATLLERYERLPAWPQLRDALLARQHGLQRLRLQALRQDLQARRSDRDRYPDPTLGVYAARERAGAENLVGVSLSFPWPGQLRQNIAREAAAEARNAAEQLAQEEARVSAEAEARYLGLRPLIRAALSYEVAARTQEDAAEKSARAYQLGEHSMTELVQNRRLGAEQRSQALLARLDALEQLASLMLDLHWLWDFDE